jgi:hypothetical protein
VDRKTFPTATRTCRPGGRRRRLLAAVLVLAGGRVAAAPGGIESVLIAKTADTADVHVRFVCPNRLLGQPPMNGVVRSEISLVRLDPCPGLGNPVKDATRPAGRALAALEQLEYMTRGGTDAVLGLRFDRPVNVTVEQSGDLHGLVLHVRAPAGSAAIETQQSAPAAVSGSGPSQEQLARAEERARRAARFQLPPATPTADFVLNLRSSTRPIDLRAESAAISLPDKVIYISDLAIDDQVWHRLRLGFFATEADANVAFNALRSRFPEGWVTRVPAAERLAAGPGATVAGPDLVEPAAVGRAGAAVLTDAEAAELIGQARGAFLDRDYPRAIELATRVLEGQPATGSPEARELLGLARERNGQIASAIAEYRRYIADFPDGEGSDRVWQRLAALTTAREQPRESIRGGAAARRDGAWDVTGGISQFYGLDSIDFAGEQGTVDQSAIFTDADLAVRHSGERFDIGSRATVNYSYDMSGGEDDPGNQSWVYNLYVDLDDRDLGLSSRLGRQTLRNQGVLGRFDGALLSWQWSPSYRLNLLGGYPVYTADESPDTDRTLYGFSVDVLNLLDMFDVNVFVNYQEADNVIDREAIGTEIRYLGENKALIASVDYDYGYSEINNVAALANWTLDNRVTLNARFDLRNSPYLITEAALVGQSANSIQALLLTYTEGQIRQLALDRSGAMQSYAVGASRPISERFQISADITASRYDGTPASGGVPETPDSGTLIYSYLSLIGSSLVREGDMSILSLRYSDGGTSKSTAVLLDTRYPVSQDLRLNPKILLSHQEIIAGDYTGLVVRAGLGLLYRLRRHFQLEFDGGVEFGQSDTGGDSTDSTGYYVYMGYTADF